MKPSWCHLCYTDSNLIWIKMIWYISLGITLSFFLKIVHTYAQCPKIRREKCAILESNIVALFCMFQSLKSTFFEKKSKGAAMKGPEEWRKNFQKNVDSSFWDYRATGLYTTHITYCIFFSISSPLCWIIFNSVQ